MRWGGLGGGGLAQLLQRGSAARGHRQQATDPAAKSRRDTQPAAVIKGRKLYRPAIQHLVSDQKLRTLPQTGGEKGLRSREIRRATWGAFEAGDRRRSHALSFRHAPPLRRRRRN
ncbi:hypothetical protein BOSE125_30316 [Bosea sp. 125]|nr:hypothetical protein BOSE125_30316 [Bosea sp. 125]